MKIIKSSTEIKKEIETEVKKLAGFVTKKQHIATNKKISFLEKCLLNSEKIEKILNNE